jgi:glycosyltransferase involved in cell wall biosynthesis
MTRIAILTPYSSPVAGGISSFVGGLQRLLVSRGHDLDIISGEGLGNTPEQSNLGSGRPFVRRSLRLLERLQPDIVHCHAHWYVLAPAIQYRRRNRRSRLVFSFHTTSMPRWAARFRRLLRDVDVITFVSASQLAEVRHNLRLGGDLRILAPATELLAVDRVRALEWSRSHGLENAFPVLAFMGPLEYEEKVRGVIDLIAAFGEIRSQFPDARLAIIGDGSLRKRVEAAASNFGDAVFITGMLSEPSLALANVDIYCHISYQEGLPIALLEAMAAGCAVVGSQTGGISEVLDGRNGLLVEPGPKPVADAIVRVATDAEAREKMGRAATETIRSFFHWESRLPLLHSVYGIGG